MGVSRDLALGVLQLYSVVAGRRAMHRYGDRVPTDATGRGGAERDDLHAAAERRLARVGQRHTKQRRAILELVSAARRPVSVPELLGDDGSVVSQSSLYRNLVVLEGVGAFAIAENRKGEQLPFSDGEARPEDKREKGRAIPTAVRRREWLGPSRGKKAMSA